MKQLRLLLVLASLINLVSACGGGSNQSSQVNLTMAPKQPVVITADFTTASGNVITAPWFQFYLNVQNNATDYVTIMAFTVNVSATRNDGTIDIASPVNIGPSDYNFTLVCSADVTLPLTFGSFGTFAPGANTGIVLTPEGVTPPSDCAGQSITVNNPPIYVGNNPNMTTDNITSYAYTVDMEVIGWFGKFDSPDARFDTHIFYSTQ